MLAWKKALVDSLNQGAPSSRENIHVFKMHPSKLSKLSEAKARMKNVFHIEKINQEIYENLRQHVEGSTRTLESSVSAQTLKSEIVATCQKFSDAVEPQKLTDDISRMEFQYLSQAAFALSEILFSNLVNYLHAVTDSSGYWEDIQGHKVKHFLSFGPTEAARSLARNVRERRRLLDTTLTPEDRERLEKSVGTSAGSFPIRDCRVLLDVLDRFEEACAGHLGRLKLDFYYIGKCSSLDALRDHISHSLTRTRSFLSAMCSDRFPYLQQQAPAQQASPPSPSGDLSSSPVARAPSVVGIISSSTAGAKSKEQQPAAGEPSSHVAALSNAQIRDALVELCDQVDAFDVHCKSVLKLAKPPSPIQRNWVAISLGTAAATAGVVWLFRHPRDIQMWGGQARTATLNFYDQHIREPLTNIIDVVVKNRGMSISDARELEEAKRSLRNMLYDLGKDLEPPASKQDDVLLQQRADALETGIFSERFEKEIQHPVKGLVAGEMVRMILLQVQRLKVDVLSALVELDQILRSNQLNFDMLATIPAILLAVGGVFWFKGGLRRRHKAARKASYKKILEHMRGVEILLNRCCGSVPKDEHRGHHGGMTFSEQGLLMVKIIRMERSLNVLHKTDQKMFREDLKELESDDLNVGQKLRTIDRMYRTYHFLGAYMRR